MNFVKFYAANRPHFQRGLRVAFLVYFLAAIVHAVTGSGPSSRRGASKSSRKGGKRDGKPPRVAVRCTTMSMNASSTDLTAEQVDDVFYKRLSNILKIVIPGIKSKEALLLCMHSSLLIFRTAISLYVASLDGK
jgi:ATP-binding cassette subfamily D (ALD) long-chain fatty acid import protein